MHDLERMARKSRLGRQVRQARRGLRAVRLARSILGVLLSLALLAVGLVALAYVVTNRANGTMVTSLGETRRYIVHVPQSYDGTTAVPLVISIHGYMDWAAHQEMMTGWSALADEEGFIVVYPLGTEFPRRWRAYATEGEAAQADVVFLTELIDKLGGEYVIDPARIYVNGLSNGAGMSLRLACEAPERVAALGLVAGAYLLPWEACAAEQAVPAVVFHGTADPLVPFGGGPSESFDEPFPEMVGWVDSLAERNGCSGETALPQSGAVGGVQYTGCTAEVRFYVIEGGGHTWPGGEPLPESITGMTTDDISATEVMWAFFQAQPLP